MASVRWSKVFSIRHKEVGATERELRAMLAALTTPLSDVEVAGINAAQANPFPASAPLHAAFQRFDPGAWRLPRRSPPAAYLDFLRWSNGGSFGNGDRWFDPFFPAGTV